MLMKCYNCIPIVSCPVYCFKHQWSKQERTQLFYSHDTHMLLITYNINYLPFYNCYNVDGISWKYKILFMYNPNQVISNRIFYRVHHAYTCIWNNVLTARNKQTNFTLVQVLKHVMLWPVYNYDGTSSCSDDSSLCFFFHRLHITHPFIYIWWTIIVVVSVKVSVNRSHWPI